MTLCIGQLHPITVYRAVLGGMCCSGAVSICVPFTISLIEFCFIRTVVTIIGILMAILFILNYTFRLSVTT